MTPPARLLLPLVLLLVLPVSFAAACEPGKEPGAVDAGSDTDPASPGDPLPGGRSREPALPPDSAAGAARDGGSLAVASAPAPLPLTAVAVALADGGVSLPLSARETPDVPVDVTFELTSEVALADVRIRLLDEAEKLVPSDDRADIGRGTRYRLAPREPLVPGSRYRLLVDGLNRPLPTGADGVAYGELSLAFRTAGEKPPPPPPPARKRQRRRGR